MAKTRPCRECGATIELRENELHEIGVALAQHTSMPPNYWQERYKAEQKLKAVRAVIEEILNANK
jgi:hypothetical protein